MILQMMFAYGGDSVFLFVLLSDGKSIESFPIENVQGLRGQISRFS